MTIKRSGPPGPAWAHRAPGGLQEALWKPFGASRLGWGPQGPKWLPGGSVEAVWGLPARLGPTDPRWLPGGSLESVWGPSAQFGAHRAPGGFQKPLWKPFGVSRPGWGPLPGASVDTTWDHLARLEPTGPQMASRRLCGAFVDFPGLAMSISQSSFKSSTHKHIQTYIHGTHLHTQ